jgi:hypothetical protein
MLKYSFRGGTEHKYREDWEELKFKMNLTIKDCECYELSVPNTHTSESRTQKSNSQIRNWYRVMNKHNFEIHMYM